MGNLKINFVKNLKSYMKNSSIHGLKHIVDDEAPWLEKLFWVCVCISCIYGTVIVFIASWRSYKENPVSFVVETTYLDWNTTFPAVTVCEKRNADKIESFSEKFFGKDRNLNLDTFLGDITFFTGVCSSCVYHCGTDITCPENLTFFTDMIRSSCKNILKDCKWNDQEFDCCKEFEPIDTGSGECYTINSMQGERWRRGERSINLTSNRITGPGILTFRAIEDVIIAIHSPEDILFSHGSPDQFSMVEYGQIMEMNFQVVEIVNDVNVRDISVNSRDCRFPDENPLTVYPVYSYSACMTECEGNAQVELCGCTHHLMPKRFLSRHPVCNISGLICINNHKEILKTVKGLWSDKPGLTCNCPSSCTEQEFKVLQSRVSDGEFEEDEGGDNSSVEADYSLRATIAMASLPTERFSRNVVRSRLDIVVSMGGTAGLFLGASLLSIVEIVYYFLIRRTGGTPAKVPRKLPNRKHKKIHVMDYRAAAACIGIKLAHCLERKCQPIRLANGRPKIQGQGRLVRFRCFKGYEFVGRRYMNCFNGQWDFERDPSINYPMCVRPGCRASSYVNGHFLETYKGAVVSVVCNLGYTLSGSSTVYCNGSQWNQPFPECKVMNPRPPKSCDFGADLCGWTQDPKGAWLRKEGQRVDSLSNENRSPEHYVVLANSNARVVNATERLFSPVFPSGYSNDSCFTFYYLLHGNNTGYLKVYVKQEGGELDNTIPPFWVTGDQGPEWLPGYIPLYPTNVSFQIIIEGISFPGSDAETAFDEVEIRSGEACNDFRLYYLSHQPPTPTTAEDSPDEDERESCKNRCGSTNSDARIKCECDESCLSKQTCCSDFDVFCRITGKMERLRVRTTLGSSGTTEPPTSFSATTSSAITASTESVTITSTSKEPTGKAVEAKVSSLPPFVVVSTGKTSTISTRTSSTTRKTSTTTTSRRRINHLDVHMHVDPSFSVEMTKSRLNEMTKDKIYRNGEDSPQLMKSEGDRPKSTPGIFPAGTMEGTVAVAAILICLASVVAFIRRRRRKKTEKESMIEDSDVRFLTSDELLDFTLARPADDDL